MLVFVLIFNALFRVAVNENRTQEFTEARSSLLDAFRVGCSQVLMEHVGRLVLVEVSRLD